MSLRDEMLKKVGAKSSDNRAEEKTEVSTALRDRMLSKVGSVSATAQPVTAATKKPPAISASPTGFGSTTKGADTGLRTGLNDTKSAFGLTPKTPAKKVLPVTVDYASDADREYTKALKDLAEARKKADETRADYQDLEAGFEYNLSELEKEEKHLQQTYDALLKNP